MSAPDAIHMESKPLLLTVRDLSQQLQVSVRTVWRLRKAGNLPKPIEIGGSVRWSAETVRQWIAEDCRGHHDGEIDSVMQSCDQL